MTTDASGVSLEPLEQQLLAYQRQTMLGSLVGLIVHEYNNLMTPVLARAQDAVARDDVAAMRKALNVTVSQTDRALRFTRKVLEMAEGHEQEAERCRLSDLIDGALSCAVRPFEKDGIDLSVDVDGDLFLLARPLLFQQMMLGILISTRESMKGKRGRLRISGRRIGCEVRIEVECPDCHLAPELVTDVINPFLASRSYIPPPHKTPLSLCMHTCRIVAKLHGARVRLECAETCRTIIEWPAG